MTDHVTEPHMVRGARDMARELLGGRWLLVCWEHLGPGENLADWTANMRAICEDMGVNLVAVNLTPVRMTLLFNEAIQPHPTQAQVNEAVRAIEHHRFTEISNEATAFKGHL